MKITKTDASPAAVEASKPTNREMQNEYNYLLAEQMTKSLLDHGLLTEEEYALVMAKNRKSFRPFFSKILA